MEKLLKIFAGLLLCLVLVCCASTTNEIDKMEILEGHTVPSWYEKPDKLSNKTHQAFVGKGVSVVARQAELLAYRDLCSNIAKYTGTELNEEDYREITTLGTLESYKLKVKKIYTSFNGANYIVFVGATAENTALEEHRGEQVIEHYKTLDKIEQIILEGDACVKDGNYIGAVKKYMQTMLLSYGLDDVQQEYSYDEIKEEVKSILNSMYFTSKLTKVNSNDLTIFLKIKETLIPSEVPGSAVEAVFDATDGRGNPYTDRFTYTTDELGKFVFSPSVFRSAFGGKVEFCFGIANEINSLRKLDEQTADEIAGIVSSKALSYEYEKKYESQSMVLTELRYLVNREFYQDKDAGLLMETQFNAGGVTCYPMLCDQDMTDEEIIAKTKAEFPDCGCLVIVRTALVRSVESSAAGIIAVAEGNAVMYNLKTGQTTADTGVISTTGFGNNREDAMKDAFENLEEIAFNYVRTEYV